MSFSFSFLLFSLFSSLILSLPFFLSSGILTYQPSRGKFGEDYFTLSSTYFQGHAPKSVNFHWRRFRVADIPLETPEVFDQWMRDRWYEKDAIMEQYISTGRLPATPQSKSVDQPEYIETEVRTKYPWEMLQVFSVVGTCWFLCRIGSRFLTRF